MRRVHVAGWHTPALWPGRQAADLARLEARMNPQVQGQDAPAKNPVPTVIDPATQMGLVALAVADLERSVTYYRDALGFAVLERAADTATLGAGGAPLLLLREERGAQPWP